MVSYPNGDVYSGDFVDGAKVGYGVEEFGVLSDNRGDTYIGQFAMMKKNGYGKYVQSDGGSYQGEWFDGWQHGRARYTYPNGAVRERVWEAGRETATPCEAWDIVEHCDVACEAAIQASREAARAAKDAAAATASEGVDCFVRSLTR